MSKEDWDAIVELGVGDHSEGKVAKAISTACKTSFTKKYALLLSLQRSNLTRHFRYNAADHPIAFHRGTDLGPIKKIAAKDVPDIEEAFDVRSQLVQPFFQLRLSRSTTLSRTMKMRHLRNPRSRRSPSIP